MLRYNASSVMNTLESPSCSSQRLLHVSHWMDLQVPIYGRYWTTIPRTLVPCYLHEASPTYSTFCTNCGQFSVIFGWTSGEKAPRRLVASSMSPAWSKAWADRMVASSRATWVWERRLVSPNSQAFESSVLTSFWCRSSGTSTMQSFAEIRARTDLKISFWLVMILSFQF